MDRKSRFTTIAVIFVAAFLLIGSSTACTKQTAGMAGKKRKAPKEAPLPEYTPIGEIEMTKAKGAFSGAGWVPSQEGSGRDGSLIEGESVYTTQDGPYSIKVKVKPVQGKKSHLIGYVMFLVKGPAVDVMTVDQIPAKIRDACGAIDADFTKALPKALQGMKTITGRGASRKTGNSEVNSEWKCVVVNYSGDREEGVLMVTMEKKIDPMGDI